ncbi:MAG TPA: class I SAM-dependent methyltransferase [Candidatus Obscuribacterales bacterium]
MPRTAVPAAITTLLESAIAECPVPIAINLWNVQYLRAYAGPVRLTLYFRHPGVLRNLLLFRDRMFLTECWISNLFDFEGSLEDMIAVAQYLSSRRLPLRAVLQACVCAATLPALSMSDVVRYGKTHTVRRVGSNASDIQHHYDVGNEFYKLFLDPNLVYSCAHFERDDFTLAQAQEAKLDLICRKLRLQPGETFLDIGCGWGALLCWAAKNYGVTACGITLSPAQREYGLKRVQEEGLANRVRIELMDYRQMPADWQFDKIASIGMIEHVGVRNYSAYFTAALDVLKHDGLFLCHGITTSRRAQGGSFEGKFVRKYIFPGGELAELPELVGHARHEGFETVDVDAWRPHYVKTLRCWSHNLQSHMEQAVDIAGERVTKLWLLYMTASAKGFEENWLRIYQVLLRRSDSAIWNLPMTRADWLM